jgi:predicted aspartyl protease
MDEPARWLVLPSDVCGELGIEMPAVDRVVSPTGETVDCETGIAMIEAAGTQGATLVYKFDGTVPKIGSIALGSLGMKVDKRTGEVAKYIQPFLRSFWPK